MNYAGTTSSFDDIDDTKIYKTSNVELETEIPNLLGLGTGSVNVGNLGFYTKPDGSGGIKLKTFSVFYRYLYWLWGTPRLYHSKRR